MRQAKTRCLEGKGHQEAPEHDAHLRAGKQTETGIGERQKEGKCSLDLMLKQTFLEKKLNTTKKTRQRNQRVLFHINSGRPDFTFSKSPSLEQTKHRPTWD